MDKSINGVIRRIEQRLSNVGGGLSQKLVPDSPNKYFKLVDRDLVVFGYDLENSELYGHDTDHVYKSSDEWATRDVVFSAPEGEYFSVRDYQSVARILNNGKIVISASKNEITENHHAALYLSDTSKKNFEQKLVMPDGYPRAGFSFADHGDILLAGEYAPQGRNVFMSLDSGENWEAIYTRPENEINLDHSCHVHDVGYDSYRGIVWSAWGDRDNSKIIYSQDYGKEWIDLYKDGERTIAPIGITSTPYFTIFSSDTRPDGIDVLPHPETTYKFLNPDGLVRRWDFKREPTDPIYGLICAREIDGVYYFFTTFSTGDEDFAAVICSPDGWNYYELIKLPITVTSFPSGIMNIFDAGENLRACVKTEIQGGFKELIIKKPKFKESYFSN